MPTLVGTKREIEFNSNLTDLIEMLKNLSVAKFRELERKTRAFDKLMTSVDTFFGLIDVENSTHAFLKPRSNKQIVIAVTSDTGLLGGLNSQVLREALAELEKIPGKLITIGEQGKIYARDYNIPFISFGGIKDEEKYAQALQIRDYVVKKLFDESFGYLKVVYPRPLSFTIQRPETISFLPYLPSGGNTSTGESITDMIMESKSDDCAEYLITVWMGEKLHEIFGLSRLAELAARFTHSEECSQKLKEIHSKLTLQYFRLSHELVDRNMREIASARVVYESQQGQ
ncbi:MAG: FoF1 ATP synthase subunit gamma [Candidatus Omnitrophota bacterium]